MENLKFKLGDRIISKDKRKIVTVVGIDKQSEFCYLLTSEEENATCTFKLAKEEFNEEFCYVRGYGQIEYLEPNGRINEDTMVIWEGRNSVESNFELFERQENEECDKMKELKFKLGDRVAYTGRHTGEKETGTIVGIYIKYSVAPYIICLDNGRGYRIFGQFKTTIKWLESFDEENLNSLIICASSNDLELLGEDESVKKRFDVVRDKKKAELEEIKKQIEEYEKAIEELKDKREVIKRDYYL